MELSWISSFMAVSVMVFAAVATVLAMIMMWRRRRTNRHRSDPGCIQATSVNIGNCFGTRNPASMADSQGLSTGLLYVLTPTSSPQSQVEKGATVISMKSLGNGNLPVTNGAQDLTYNIQKTTLYEAPKSKLTLFDAFSIDNNSRPNRPAMLPTYMDNKHDLMSI